jgi:type IV pilus assembly protein PilA
MEEIMLRLRGFTLMELTVVIIIIGILAAIAIPSYQTHVIRARVLEGYALGVSGKFAVAENLIRNNCHVGHDMGAGFQSPQATENVSSISIEKETGNVVIHYTPIAGDGTIVLEPKCQTGGQISWECTKGTLLSKYRPSNCK